MPFRTLLLFILNSFYFPFVIAQNSKVITGAEQTENYINDLRGKKIACVVNQTSVIGKTWLVDSLVSLHITIKKIFAPEHGVRGNLSAGETVNDSVDNKTGIQIISLYGKNLRPTSAQLKNIDEVVYDIQDVGVRCFTYISTLHLVMEACAENNVPLLILDRPDPNGFYVDGPVLDTSLRSFAGMDPVPLVYGMTIGEYAQMLNGEQWLKNRIQCQLKIISCKNYSHKTLYNLTINPSPNLRSMTAVYLYPSLVLFEGTAVSVGRGTDFPFEQIGFPDNRNGKISFTPGSTEAAKNPPYMNEVCQGLNLSGLAAGFFLSDPHIQLIWMEQMFDSYSDSSKFFNPYFEKLAGTKQLRIQIEQHVPEMEIRKSWQPQLQQFLNLRKKYLMYEDF